MKDHLAFLAPYKEKYPKWDMRFFDGWKKIYQRGGTFDHPELFVAGKMVEMIKKRQGILREDKAPWQE